LIVSVEKVGKLKSKAIRKWGPVIWIIGFKNRRFIRFAKWIAVLIAWFTYSLSTRIYQKKMQIQVTINEWVIVYVATGIRIHVWKEMAIHWHGFGTGLTRRW